MQIELLEIDLFDHLTVCKLIIDVSETYQYLEPFNFDLC